MKKNSKTTFPAGHYRVRDKARITTAEYGQTLTPPPTPPSPFPPTTIRGEILKTASDITLGDRNQSYGDPYHQLGLAGRIIRLLHEANDQHGLRHIGDAEWNAIESVALKLSRTCLGTYNKDNYIDGTTYFAIAGECAERAGNGERPRE